MTRSTSAYINVSIFACKKMKDESLVFYNEECGLKKKKQFHERSHNTDKLGIWRCRCFGSHFRYYCWLKRNRPGESFKRQKRKVSRNRSLKVCTVIKRKESSRMQRTGYLLPKHNGKKGLLTTKVLAFAGKTKGVQYVLYRKNWNLL